MTFSDHTSLELDGQTWEYVKDRFMGGQVYRSPDGLLFLRIGDPIKITSEANFARDMFVRGFPVPEVIEDGQMGDAGFYIEKAVGDTTYGQIFDRQYSQSGIVDDVTFTELTEVSIRFLRAQLSPENHVAGVNELRQGINTDNVIEENPDVDTELFDEVLAKVIHRTQHLPLVLSHGDFGPFNILPDGVIDFEHKFVAPAGFDVLTSVFFGRFWNFTNAQGVSMLAYDFSDDQISSYMQQVDEVAASFGINHLSGFIDDFLVLKSIWAVSYEKTMAAQQGGDSLKHEWRKAAMSYSIHQYMNDLPIDSKTFGHPQN